MTRLRIPQQLLYVFFSFYSACFSCPMVTPLATSSLNTTCATLACQHTGLCTPTHSRSRTLSYTHPLTLSRALLHPPTHALVCSLCIHVSHLRSSSFLSSSLTHFSLLKRLGLPLLLFPLVVRVHVHITKVHTLRGPYIRIVTVLTLTGVTRNHGMEKEHVS